MLHSNFPVPAAHPASPGALPAELPTALYSAAQVRALDEALIAAGTPGFELMQRAAHAAWRALRRRWPQTRALSVLAGRGNNAGDGYLIAALARRAGWSAQVLAVGEPAQLQGDAALAHAAALAAGVAVQPWCPGVELAAQISHAAPITLAEPAEPTAQVDHGRAGSDAESGVSIQPEASDEPGARDAAIECVLVDALLGTGLAGAVREPYAEAIGQLNASGLPVLAVDIPSGLCADSGSILGVAVQAELTVSFIGLKIGLLTGEGPAMVGELVFADLHADPELLAQMPALAERLAPSNLSVLAPRPRTVHKGQLGHVLVVGGDHGFGGAALLAAQSALRAGAGLVSLATRGAHVPAALARCPELMTLSVASANQLLALAEQASVLVIGPGLGQAAWGRSLLSLAAHCRVPQVWDADALNVLALGAVSLPLGCVITPHPGEAARLLGVSTAQVQADRPAAARALAEKYQAVAVLKGAGTLIAAPGGALVLCDRGHPAMASAGLGDVLSGLLGALLAQGLEAFATAQLAVWLHASAGEQLGSAGRGLLASALLPLIRQLLEEHSPCLK
ncbi:MAG: NAD(P)H-hydrate dehydratase [Pseudomonas sp.]